MNTILNTIGTNVAAQKAKFRRQFGVPITPLQADGTIAPATVRGTNMPLWMRTHSLEKREREYLPEGFQNAADADLRVFEASPVDFTDTAGRLMLPAVGSLWSWNGISFTLLAVHPGDDEIKGVLVTLLLFAYRTPPPDSAASETAAEAAQNSKWPTPPS